MQSSGMKIARANDTLSEAILLYEQGNYMAAQSMAQYVGVIFDKASQDSALIDEAESSMYQAKSKGANVLLANETLFRGIDAFDSERYEDAETLLKQSIAFSDEAESNVAVQSSVQGSQAGIVSELKANWILVAIAFASAFFIGFAVRQAAKPWKRGRKISRLNAEKQRIEALLRKKQEEYFNENAIGKKDYQTALRLYKRRLEQVKRELSMAKK